jgi:large subunit ribosomal protein L25
MAKKQADKLTINATKREVLGKQVKKLRKEGFVPANIYGKDFNSAAITLTLNDFTRIYNEAGETGVVYVSIEGGDKDIPTLIKSVQTHPVNDFILHVDFRKINLKQKIETEVPLSFIGESPTVKQGAVVLYQMDTITIEALPTDIPSEIEVDLSTITEIGQDIRVSNLPKSDKFEYITDPEMVLVSTTEHKEEDLEPDTTTVIPEGEEGAEAAEGGEEAATDAPAEEKASE